MSLNLHRIKELRYGENPHQRAAWYELDQPVGLAAAEVLQGKELSFTNLLDLDSAARIAPEFAEPAAAVIKHTNPCGAAIGRTIDEAYVRARDADPLAAFGGIIGLNRSITADGARALVSTFVEAVIAPGVEEDARPILAKKPNMRVVVANLTPVNNRASRRELRSILGAMLVQQRDVVEAVRRGSAKTWPNRDEGLTTRAPTTRNVRSATRAGACVRSQANAVISHATRTGHRPTGREPRRRRSGGGHESADPAARTAGGIGGGVRRVFPFRDA